MNCYILVRIRTLAPSLSVPLSRFCLEVLQRALLIWHHPTERKVPPFPGQPALEEIEILVPRGDVLVLMCCRSRQTPQTRRAAWHTLRRCRNCRPHLPTALSHSRSVYHNRSAAMSVPSSSHRAGAEAVVRLVTSYSRRNLACDRVFWRASAELLHPRSATACTPPAHVALMRRTSLPRWGWRTPRHLSFAGPTILCCKALSGSQAKAPVRHLVE